MSHIFVVYTFATDGSKIYQNQFYTREDARGYARDLKVRTYIALERD